MSVYYSMIEREKKGKTMNYTKTLKNKIKELNTKKNIDMVNNGVVGSVQVKVNAPLGCIDFRTRQEGLQKDFVCDPFTILNSPFNREPFLTDEKTFVSKTCYLIRNLYGVAAFQELPVSLISNPSQKVDSGIRMSECLQAKDRGHFMTVSKYMITEGMKKEEYFWKKVVTKLKSETLSGNETPASLIDFQENGLMNKLSELKEQNNIFFSLEDLLPTEIYNRFFTVEETISIRLETVNTHKTEIQKINNGENTWKPHNFGLTNLVDNLILRQEWGYNQNKVDEICSESDLMLGNRVLLSSRKDVNFSGYLTEPSMLFVSSLDMDWNSNLYKFLGGIGNHNDYVTYLCDKTVTTKMMKTWIKRLDRLSEMTNDKGYNLWQLLDDAIVNHHSTWIKTAPKDDSNYMKLRPRSMDTGLLYLRGIHKSIKDLKMNRGREGSYDSITRSFIEYFIGVIENDTHTYEQWVSNSASSWKGRFDDVFSKLFERFVKNYTETQGDVKSEKVLIDEKLRELRDTGKLPAVFPMYDRERTGEWKITDINLETGKGLQLCHKLSEKNGGLRTYGNTFMGPALDNNVQGGNDCSDDYLFIDMDNHDNCGEFWKNFTNDVEFNNNPMSLEQEAYLNTMKFCNIVTQYILTNN